jgi:heme/copper-type cytochrome/quinol oxidase subunit 2
MKKIIENIKKAGLITFGLLLPALASAVDIRPDPISGLPGDRSSTFTDEISTIIQIILAVVGLIAVAFLIWGGFRYITSAGNDEVAEEGKKTIQNAIIGLVVIILSYIIVTVIANALVRGPVGA